MNSPTPDILIIGFGNDLRGDDGAGPEAARRLAKEGYRALAVPQLVPELAEEIATAREVWFIDADMTLLPGELQIARLGESPAGPLDHHSTPAALLRMAREVYGASPRAWFTGIGGSTFELGAPLSSETKRTIARFCGAFPCA